MGLRAGLDWCGKSRPTGNRSADRPARNSRYTDYATRPKSIDISSQKLLFQGYRLVITTSTHLILMASLNSVIISFFLS